MRRCQGLPRPGIDASTIEHAFDSRHGRFVGLLWRPVRWPTRPLHPPTAQKRRKIYHSRHGEGLLARKNPQWLEYEKLAAKIIEELSPHAHVTHNEYIVGRESEARRQIDVTARWTDGDVDRVLIVQVKDY